MVNVTCVYPNKKILVGSTFAENNAVELETKKGWEPPFS
jgi:hypothetical protein